MASSGRLKSGEKGAITARVATTTKKGFVLETINVKSNDPKRPKVALTLQALIMENSPAVSQPGQSK
jgi:hypothetical protein